MVGLYATTRLASVLAALAAWRWRLSAGPSVIAGTELTQLMWFVAGAVASA